MKIELLQLFLSLTDEEQEAVLEIMEGMDKRKNPDGNASEFLPGVEKNGRKCSQ